MVLSLQAQFAGSCRDDGRTRTGACAYDDHAWVQRYVPEFEKLGSLCTSRSMIRHLHARSRKQRVRTLKQYPRLPASAYLLGLHLAERSGLAFGATSEYAVRRPMTLPITDP